jgi:hypothetical protein
MKKELGGACGRNGKSPCRLNQGPETECDLWEPIIGPG